MFSRAKDRRVFSCRIPAACDVLFVNMSETDLELLARYFRQNAEDAFSEIVRRHVDLVHSAALRQVRSPQLAEEVAQSTFLKLARHASEFAPDTIVTAWLYQVTRREAIDVVRREARRQLREQIASEMNAMNATADDWSQIEPLLDEAMHALDETDRAAVLLRYFENKSLREVGATIGTSDDTAQKRISRAVERLREFFNKRGVTIGANGLVVVLSANAVQSAPAALAQGVTAMAMTTTAAAGTANLIPLQTLKLMASTKLKTIAVAAVLILLAGVVTTVILKTVRTTQATAHSDITGAWEGVSEIPRVTGVLQGEKATTRVVFRFFKTNGAYTAIGELIDTSPNRFEAIEFTYNPPEVRFRANANETFQGTLNAGANEITGTWTEKSSWPLLLKRTTTPATAPVPLTESDYTRRAGSDLQGRWRGSLGSGVNAVKVTVKIAEPSAGTFRAELDNTTGPWLRQPMTVTYQQPRVTLLVTSRAGMFEGTMNGDATEMVGIWKQGGKQAPAILRRADQ